MIISLSNHPSPIAMPFEVGPVSGGCRLRIRPYKARRYSHVRLITISRYKHQRPRKYRTWELTCILGVASSIAFPNDGQLVASQTRNEFFFTASLQYSSYGLFWGLLGLFPASGG